MVFLLAILVWIQELQDSEEDKQSYHTENDYVYKFIKNSAY